MEIPSIDSGRLRNISRLPIPQPDDRIVMWEPERKRIDPIEPSDDHSASLSSRLSRFVDHLQSEFDDLDPEKQKQLNEALINRNGLIVEHNKLVTALLGCNSNVGLLGSEEQSKNSLCYLLKYVTKQNTGITHSASLILHARRVIEQFPSVAEDTGTLERTAMHLLNRVTNRITCAVEVSSHMAALALLGAPAEFVSCPFQKVFVQEAANYATNHQSFKDSVPEQEEFRELPGDEWIEDGDEVVDEDVENADENCLIPEGLYDEDFNARLLECLGEEDFVNDDLR